MTNPLVSIACITYNHEKYICDAIEGFLMQKTTFPIEIIIHDDASTDNTVIVLKEYAQKNPNLIIPIFQKENQFSNGINPGFKFVFPKCRGKYVAVCEGDDFWTDPYKLQKQVAYLEANPEYGMVCTNYHKYFQKRGIFKKNCFLLSKYKNDVKFEDYILDRSTISTATVLFRADLINKYNSDIPQKLRSFWIVGDTPLWLYFSIVSKIKVLPDVTAVYRINQNSASKFTDVHKRYRFRIKGFEIPFFFLDFGKANDEIRKKLEISYNSMFIRYRYDAKDSMIGIGNYIKLKQLKGSSFDIWIRYHFYNKHFLAKVIMFPLSYVIRKVINMDKVFSKS